MGRPPYRPLGPRTAWYLLLGCALAGACGEGGEQDPPAVRDAASKPKKREADAGDAGKDAAVDPGVEPPGRMDGSAPDATVDAAAKPDASMAHDASVAPDASAAPDTSVPPERPMRHDEAADDVPYEPLAAVEPDLTGLVTTSAERIVFRTEGSGLFLLDVTSGQVHDLNPERAPIASTMPAPDGKVLLFSAADSTGDGGVFLVRFAANGFVPARRVAGFAGIGAVHAALPAKIENGRAWSHDDRFVALRRSDEPGIDVVDTWAGARVTTVGARPDVSQVDLGFGSDGWFLYWLTTPAGRVDAYARLGAGGKSGTVMLTPEQRSFGLSLDGKRLYYTDASSGSLVGRSRALEAGDEITFVTHGEGEVLDFSVRRRDTHVVYAHYRNRFGLRELRELNNDGKGIARLVTDPERDLLGTLWGHYSADVLVQFYASSLGVRIEIPGGSSNVPKVIADGSELQMSDFTYATYPYFQHQGELRVITSWYEDGSVCLPTSPSCFRGSGYTIESIGTQGPYDCLDVRFEDGGAYEAALERGTGRILIFDPEQEPERGFDPALPAHGGSLSCPTWNPAATGFAYVEHAAGQDTIQLMRWDAPAPLQVHATADRIGSIELTLVSSNPPEPH